jgi:hypothetical protein
VAAAAAAHWVVPLVLRDSYLTGHVLGCWVCSGAACTLASQHAATCYEANGCHVTVTDSGELNLYAGSIMPGGSMHCTGAAACSLHQTVSVARLL